LSGTYNLLNEIPSGLICICQYSDGTINFETLQINPGIISFMLRGNKFDEFLSDDYKSKNRIEKNKLQHEFEEKFNTNIANGEKLTDSEVEFFLIKGFLGLLEMRCPDLQKNEVFVFLNKMINVIEKLETESLDKSYEEIISSIHINLLNQDSPDFNLWNAINLNYTENPFWVADKSTGLGGLREEYIEFLKIHSNEKTEYSENNYNGSISNLINEFLNQRGFETLTQCFEAYGLPDLKNIDDFLEFCKLKDLNGYEMSDIGNNNLDALMLLYYKIKEIPEHEHSISEIFEGIQDSREGDITSALNELTKETESPGLEK